MALKYGKAQVNKIVDVLDQDHETIEDAARAVLEAAERIFEERAKFVVVGQLAGTKDRLTIPSNDPEAIKVSLGWYSTEGEARSAAESLYHSTASGDTYRTWVLPTFHGTPAQLHDKAKRKYQAEMEKAADKAMERIRASIEKRMAEEEKRAQLMRAPCLCGHKVLDHQGQIDKAGRCNHIGCRCEKFERGDQWRS